METQAVSDGELNMSRLSGGGSSHSLGGTSSLAAALGGDGPASRVVSWAVCFEKLLEDPMGVRYFTAFLQSEVSAENILFWQACEKFRQIPATQATELKEEACSIYNTYLSVSSFHAVNIDDTARTEERDLDHPTPDMFHKAQQQIFKLMKFDSYTRFVRSPLYQSCMLASVEGRPLPNVGGGSRERITLDSKKGQTWKVSSSENRTTRKQRLEKTGSWGADVSYHRANVSRKESQISMKSTSSLELGSIYCKSENGQSSPWDPELDSAGAGLGQAEKYCCVYLPDGTASLAPARPGLPVSGMLSGLCEKRGFPLKDVFIYLRGKDKQRLSLEQDSSVLRDQQVTLELRVTFVIEVMFTGKTVGVMVKSSKTLQDALSVVLQKHHLRPQDAVITMSGSKEPVNMNTNAFRLANKTLYLDKVKAGPGSPEALPPPQAEQTATVTRPRNPYDMDGLIQMLSRAQCSRVDDQRGLLRKEHLVLPQFLLLPEGPRGGQPGGDGEGLEQSPGEGGAGPI